uniref:Uncharacterized protein LOC105851687 n=1 Tax=Cicer arietinum TaxID=3827 RepID=A0A3Q7XUA4_CICAR|nr:uncharacterized protein LOC105851687 [Cicer arietinum]
MKSNLFALLLIFSLLMVGNMSNARKDVGEYWKNKMNEQVMPEAIKNLVQVQKQDHFVRDFDVHPNIILYHTHVHENKEKPFEP